MMEVLSHVEKTYLIFWDIFIVISLVMFLNSLFMPNDTLKTIISLTLFALDVCMLIIALILRIIFQRKTKR